MRLFNTLTKQKEDFIPRDGNLPASKAGKVQMFVCGPTVYDFIHIGNARTFVFFDVVAKYLKYKGYDVTYIQNITDIDNKIIERAQKENADPLEYAKKYTEIFKEDMKSLGITAPEYKNATDHIPEVIKQVQTLTDKGNAYTIEGDGIYFDLSTFSDYGKLSSRTANMADDAVSRIDDSNKKRNKGDFALWKFRQDNDPYWSAPFGEGRPGWHIEDTSITEKYFGPQYDIHGGGQDLIFPHHEAEIAQQESASGLKPFVKYWMHGGFLVKNSGKMSKSIGNFDTLRDVLKSYQPEALRFYFLSAHYRSPLNFDDKSLPQSQAAVNKISDFFQKLNKVDGSDNQEVNQIIEEAVIKYIKSMDDDLNIPEAFASIFELIKKVNPILISNGLSSDQSKKISTFLESINQVLGIIPSEEQKIPKEVSELLEKRENLRQENKYTESDKIRSQIEDLGYKIEDTIYGPLVIRLKKS